MFFNDGSPDILKEYPKRITAYWPVCLTLAFAVLIVAINPMGYFGGGGDDWQYFEAAKCVADQGWCIPKTHWAARWPLVVPMAFSLNHVHDARLALELVGGFYGFAALMLVMHLAFRTAGMWSAAVAGLAFVATPIVANSMISTNVEMPELAFLLAGIGCIVEASEGRTKAWAFAAGLFFALAFATRETSIAAMFPISALALWHRRYKLLLWCIPGFLAPLVAESFWHFWTSGDALLRLHLAASHTSIMSSEMTGVPRNSFPLFNMDIVSRWKSSMGIHVHWFIDPVVNLIANPACALTLMSAVMLLMIGRRHNTPQVMSIAFAALLSGLTLIYALAIDPKPRMFFFALAMAATLIGVVSSTLWRARERLIPGLLIFAIAYLGISIMSTNENLINADKTAKSWLADPSFRPHVDPSSKKFLAMVEGIDALPMGTERPYLSLTYQACKPDATRNAVIPRRTLPVINWLQERGAMPHSSEQLSLCLYE